MFKGPALLDTLFGVVQRLDRRWVSDSQAAVGRNRDVALRLRGRRFSNGQGRKLGSRAYPQRGAAPSARLRLLLLRRLCRLDGETTERIDSNAVRRVTARILASS
jgi:hypothetical protein